MAHVHKDSASEEWFYPEEGYILSETDENGIILYANELFCEVAGYDASELVGQPHSIVRHPDMPRAAFKGLWEDLRSKGFWTGLVKNRRKDNGYYWVYATALRRVGQEGRITYLSIRTKPSRSEVEAIEKVYAKLREAER